MGLRHAADRERVLEVARGAAAPQAAAAISSRRRAEAATSPACGRIRAAASWITERFAPKASKLERGRDQHALGEVGGVDQHERAAAHRHAVRADQRQRLLGLERDRLEPAPARSACAPGQRLAAELGVAAADQHLADVGHLREVALPDRADHADDRVHAGVERGDEQLDQLAAHADAGLRHPVRARQHHRAHDVGRERPPVARRSDRRPWRTRSGRSPRSGCGDARASRVRC